MAAQVYLKSLRSSLKTVLASNNKETDIRLTMEARGVANARAP